MGGKGAPSSDTQMSSPQTLSNIQEMMGLFESMAGMNSTLMAMMQSGAFSSPQIPEIFKEPSLDWAEENERLRNKLEGDQKLLDKQKRNRTSTILTSPLLDEEDPAVKKSILS